MGISLMKYRLMAFVISTINAALGGLLYMLYVRNMTTSTSTLLTLTTSLNILGAVIIGGPNRSGARPSAPSPSTGSSPCS